MGAGRLIVVGVGVLFQKQVFTAISGKPRAKESNGNVQGGINFFVIRISVKDEKKTKLFGYYRYTCQNKNCSSNRIRIER